MPSHEDKEALRKDCRRKHRRGTQWRYPGETLNEILEVDGGSEAKTIFHILNGG